MKTKQIVQRSFMPFAAMVLIMNVGCKPGGEAKATAEAVDPPKQIISKEQAATLFKEYSDRRIPYVVAALDSTEQEGFIPARYTEFDFDVIENYIAYIKQEAAAADKKIEKLRIYYAVYPPGMGSKSKKSTVFLVPSTSFPAGNRAFQVRTDGESTEAIAIPWDFGTGAKQMGMQMQQDQRQYATFGPVPSATATTPVQSNKSLVLNDGTTAPPPYN